MILPVFFVAGVVAAPAEESVPARRVSVPGLPHQSVLSLLEDRDGFLWIGTSDGLARFDGIDTVVYKYDPLDPHGLAGGAVTALFEDSRGVLWVGTNNGLQTFDREQQRFSGHDEILTHEELVGANVTFVLEDPEGSLWFGTLGSGLFRYDTTSSEFIHLSARAAPKPSIAHDTVRASHVDGAGHLWILVGEGHALSIQRLGVDGGFRTVATDVPASWALFVDDSGTPWTDPEGPEPFDHLDTPDQEDRIDRQRETRAIATTADGAFWFGDNTGLYRRDPQDGPEIPETMIPSPHGYLDTFVRTLMVGRSDILWIGTQGGLFALDPQAKAFHHCLVQPAPTSAGPQSAAVSAIVEGADKTLWVATFGNGLFQVDRSCRILARYDQAGHGNGALLDDIVWDLAPDGMGGLWIASGGLSRLDLESGHIAHHPISIEVPIQVVMSERDGEVWTGSRQGLAHYDPGSRTYRPIDLDQPDGSGAPIIDSLTVDGDGIVWAGSPEGVFRFDSVSGSVQRLPLTTPGATPVRSTGTWNLVPQDDDTVWVGTAVGLARHDEGTDSVVLELAGADLPGSSVFSVLPDETGRLWLATNQGLATFDRSAAEGSRLRHYSSIDGLGNTEFNRHAACITSDGTFYFGGIDGLTWFRPDDIRDNDFAPPIRLTGIEITGDRGTREISPHGLERIELEPTDVMLVVQFAALSFTNPNQNRYAYRLEGFDPLWIDAGDRRFAQYSRLPHGEYVLRVRGSNNDGVWNEEGLHLHVVVASSWWQTLWFKALVAALMAGVLLWIRNYRKTKAHEVQQLRLRIAGDLHDDLSSDLSGVAVVADMIRKNPALDEPQREDLAMIRDTAVRMVDGVRDIVWYIDPEHDSIEAMVDRMRTVAERLLRGINYRFDVAVSRRIPNLSMEIRKDLYLVFKEALQNVVRHAEAREVAIDFIVNRRHVRLTIRDDGVGFDPAADADGTGLRSIRRRADQLGATLEILGSAESGSAIDLVLDLTNSRDRRAPSKPDTL
jgi:signal transduction histidine kinase/ligand-binding sensor domain-containing protein